MPLKRTKNKITREINELSNSIIDFETCVNVQFQSRHIAYYLGNTYTEKSAYAEVLKMRGELRALISERDSL